MRRGEDFGSVQNVGKHGRSTCGYAVGACPGVLLGFAFRPGESLIDQPLASGLFASVLAVSRAIDN
jgi:hypothetical protein